VGGGRGSPQIDVVGSTADPEQPPGSGRPSIRTSPNGAANLEGARGDGKWRGEPAVLGRYCEIIACNDVVEGKRYDCA